MPFEIVRNDITRMKADAIVNTANPYPRYAGVTDRRIYEAAGAEELLKERKEIGIIQPGHAAVTNPYRLNCKIIIHTVGPVWVDGNQEEVETLKSCLRESLRLAEEHDCSSIAFPLISTGVYGFPKELAIQTFLNVIYEYLMQKDRMIWLVVYDQEAFSISTKMFGHVEDFFLSKEENIAGFEEAIQVEELDFHEFFIQLLCDSNRKNSEIYLGANITKQHFSKILSSADYTPKKNTICALALSLHLDLKTTGELLAKAGYALTDSKPFDLAVKYFITHKMYNLVEDNVILFDHDIEQLGTIS